MRYDGRQADDLRPLKIKRRYTRTAPGSVLISAGQTTVLCCAAVAAEVPAWLKGQGRGWLTAEYSMLPGSTSPRKRRERGANLDGRTTEIQRLIGRSLRAVVDRKAMGEMSVTLDCDVLNADGGTRCASITGAYVALTLAFRKLVENRVIAAVPLLGHVAAISCGLIDGKAVLDLDYAEDSTAQADANFVLTEDGIVEIQGTAEQQAFSEQQFHDMMALAKLGTAQLFAAQRAALGATIA